MATPCEVIVRQHLAHVSDQFECAPLSDDQLLLITPYTYADGDLIEMIVMLRGPRLVLTDDGQALGRLEMAGVNPESAAVASALGRLRKQLPVEFADGELLADGELDAAGGLVATLSSAMREVDALQSLRPKPKPIPFERKLLSHLHALHGEVEEHPRLRGTSGTRYRLTAAVGTEDPILLQAIAGGNSLSGSRAVNHAFRAFYDINGAVDPAHKVAVLSEDGTAWRQGDIALLRQVAVVAGWWDREALDQYLSEPRGLAGGVLFATQPELD